jgi:phosphoribosylaminoimidazole-succinocarboxamide synthase
LRDTPDPSRFFDGEQAPCTQKNEAGLKLERFRAWVQSMGSEHGFSPAIVTRAIRLFDIIHMFPKTALRLPAH